MPLPKLPKRCPLDGRKLTQDADGTWRCPRCGWTDAPLPRSKPPAEEVQKGGEEPAAEPA